MTKEWPTAAPPAVEAQVDALMKELRSLTTIEWVSASKVRALLSRLLVAQTETEAQLHSLIQDFEAVTNPLEFPDLHHRAFGILDACSNPLCAPPAPSGGPQ